MPDLPNGLERLLPGDITWREVINDNLARLDRAWIDAGLASERPDSAATGHARFWYAKDTNVLSWDTGSGWIDVVGGDVDLTSDVTGILPVENGGTGLSSIAANNILYTSANDTLEAAAITAFGRSLIDDADASTARGTLGLGTLAVENAASIGVNLIPDGSRNLGGVANPWLEGFFSSSVNTQVGNDFTSGTGRFQIIRGGNSHSLCWDKDRQNFFLGTDGAGSTNGVLAVLGLRTRTTLAGGDIGESAYRFGTAFLNDIDLPNLGTIEIGDVELSRASAGVLAVDGDVEVDGSLSDSIGNLRTVVRAPSIVRTTAAGTTAVNNNNFSGRMYVHLGANLRTYTLDNTLPTGTTFQFFNIHASGSISVELAGGGQFISVMGGIHDEGDFGFTGPGSARVTKTANNEWLVRDVQRGGVTSTIDFQDASLNTIQISASHGTIIALTKGA